MAEPLIKTQDVPSVQNFDPFSQTSRAKQMAQGKQRYEANRALYKELDKQRYAAGQGSAEWNRLSPIMDQMNQEDPINMEAMQGFETISGHRGRAMADEWVSLVDPATGKLRDNYQLSQYKPEDEQGFQQFKQEALRAPGQQSAWAGIQQQKLGAEEAQAKDAAARQAMTSQSQALGSLAMRGGVGSGTQASLAKDMQRQLLNQRQAVGRQGMMSRFDLAKTDEESRQRNLGQLVGFEKEIATGKKRVEESNLNRLMGEIEKRRQFDSDKYRQQMKEYGAAREADAAMSAGGGGK